MPIYTIRDDALNEESTSYNNGRNLVRKSDGSLWCCYMWYSAVTGKYEIHVSYSTDEGATWTEEAVATDPAIHYMEPAMAVDSQDYLHLVYRNYNDDEILYRERTTIWSAEEVVENTFVSADASIAIDSNDNIHVAYRARHPIHVAFNIRYREKTSGGWQAAEWVTEMAVGVGGQYFPSVGIDSGDNIHIAWQGSGTGLNPNVYNMQYRRKTIAGWQAQETVTDLPIMQYAPSIAIDSSDNIHICWYSGLPTEEVRYMLRTGVGWQPQQTVAPVGFYPTIALDLDDNIFITYSAPVGPDEQIWIAERPIGELWIRTNITNSAFDNAFPILIWANHPTISGAKTNIPRAGCALVFGADTAIPEVRYYYPVDLSWESLVAIPTVTTNLASAISHISATLNGTLVDDGGEPCGCGFEWGETEAYEHGATPPQTKITGQSFLQAISGLSPNTTYHFRAFATNSAGTSYGTDRSFATLLAAPIVTTEPATEVVQKLATLKGTLDNDGGEACQVRFQYGLTDAYGTDTEWQPGKVTDDTFGETISGLEPNTTYHFRAQAKNSAGTASGADRTFTTLLAPVPLIINRAYALSREEL